MASKKVSATLHLDIRVLKLQLKVINRNVCYLYTVWVNQLFKVTLPLVTLYSFQNF